jgi:hypothetical protein
MTKITTTGIMDIAANTCLKMYASLIKGVSDASAVKDSKCNTKSIVQQNNKTSGG